MAAADPGRFEGRGFELTTACVVQGVEKQLDEAAFKQVSKALFEEMYFRLGREQSGWTADYWRKVIEPQTGLGWRFLVEEPASAEHTRMWIVTDPNVKEHRLFFMTEQAEEDFFDLPE